MCSQCLQRARPPAKQSEADGRSEWGLTHEVQTIRCSARSKLLNRLYCSAEILSNGIRFATTSIERKQNEETLDYIKIKRHLWLCWRLSITSISEIWFLFLIFILFTLRESS
jgi:hypothetical protein